MYESWHRQTPGKQVGLTPHVAITTIRPSCQLPMSRHHAEYDYDDPIYTTRRTRSALELRGQQPSMTPSTRSTAHLPRATALSAIFGEGVGWRKPKITQITTALGQLGAGETETEADEPVRVASLYAIGSTLSAGGSKRPLLPSQTIFRPPVSCLFQNHWSHLMS